MAKTPVAIIGSGNIGTDLMVKIIRRSDTLEVAAFVGIDPESDGLARARRLGVPSVDTGVAGLIALDTFDEIAIVFDATSAKAHEANAAALAPYGKRLVDLTPAALGPYVVPPVNLDEHRTATNINMVTCGGQATIPIVAAVSTEVEVLYAEIVASIASKSAGPGTRANIDEFTETTRHAIIEVGGAANAKAIIILNPADPPLMMRDTVLCLIPHPDAATRDRVRASVHSMVERVQAYVPGYRLKHDLDFRDFEPSFSARTLIGPYSGPVTQVSVFLEVEGAGNYLPTYAGNLDIMTSAALRAGEVLAEQLAPSREGNLT